MQLRAAAVDGVWLTIEKRRTVVPSRSLTRGGVTGTRNRPRCAGTSSSTEEGAHAMKPQRQEDL